MTPMHPLLTPVEIPGPKGAPIDLCLPRSRGPLRDDERSFLQQRSLSLAYDPVQEGWLPSGAIDDLQGDDMAALLGDADALARRLNPAANARLEARALQLMESLRRGETDGAAAAVALWSSAESLVRECGSGLSAAQQRDAIRYLQARAARIADAQLIPDEQHRRLQDDCQVAREHYQLRPWREEEVERFVELLDDPAIWEHLPEDYPDPLTPALAADLIRLSNEGVHHEVCAIERAGEVVGQVRLSFEGPLLPRGRAAEAEISYWLGASYWGQGIISAVIPLYTETCFRTRPLRSIYARVAQANTASARVLEKSAYRYEGGYLAELSDEPQMRTYRCFREDYLGSD